MITKLQPSIGLRLSEQDFGTQVKDNVLLLPIELSAALHRLNAHTLEGFLSYVQSFPSVLALHLGWQTEDVVKARETLYTQLRGNVPENFLENPPVSFGAKRKPTN